MVAHNVKAYLPFHMEWHTIASLTFQNVCFFLKVEEYLYQQKYQSGSTSVAPSKISGLIRSASPFGTTSIAWHAMQHCNIEGELCF